MAKELEAESYHDIKRITARKDNVIRLWEYLLELLRARRHRLEMNLGLQRVFQEMLYIMDWMDEMKVRSGNQSDSSVVPNTENEMYWIHLDFAVSVLTFDLLSPADAAALSGLWETPAGCGGPAAETRSGGGRHRHPGRPRPKRQQERSEVC